jgi:hypothetical protein
MKSLPTYCSRFFLVITLVLLMACSKTEEQKIPTFKLLPADRFVFKSFVDCNMSVAWVGDTLRIFPGKYGEDPVWGSSEGIKYAEGTNPDAVFLTPYEDFKLTTLPPNTPPGTPGLHGAVWFETLYQDMKDPSGKTLYAIYHNENYPETLPYDPATGEGYLEKNWPQGLRGPESAAAVCRIGIMKSTDGGKVWDNHGIFIEDLQPRMILKHHNYSNTFAGGVGDPSAVASGDHLYLFYGEYGFPGEYDSATYSPETEASGQCISIARIKLADLDNPVGKAKRWDGTGFNAPHNGVGKPIPALQIPVDVGGGPASGKGEYHWGPSVSWNYYLNCWVMLMGKVDDTSWKGSSIYISFNMNKDLDEGDNAIQWSKPMLVLTKPGRVLWYPALQPMNTEEDIKNKNTSMRTGKRARLFVKDSEANEYSSMFIIEFEKP